MLYDSFFSSFLFVLYLCTLIIYNISAGIIGLLSEKQPVVFYFFVCLHNVGDYYGITPFIR